MPMLHHHIGTRHRTCHRNSKIIEWEIGLNHIIVREATLILTHTVIRTHTATTVSAISIGVDYDFSVQIAEVI